MGIWRWIVRCTMVPCSLAGGIANAQFESPQPAENLASIKTPSGVVTVERAKGAVCDLATECRAIRLAGKVIATDWLASLDSAYPSIQKAELVFYSTHSGGNAAPASIAFLDVGNIGKPFNSASLFYDRPRVAREGPDRFVMIGNGFETTKLGDAIETTYIYDRERRLVFQKPLPGMFDYIQFVGKHPQDLFRSPEGRAPLLRMIGEDKFADFRAHLSVATDLRLEGHRWLIGHGCLPHSCTASEGFVAIDIVTGHAYAAQFTTDWQSGRLTVVGWGHVEGGVLNHSVYVGLHHWLKPTGIKVRDGTTQLRFLNPKNISNDGAPTYTPKQTAASAPMAPAGAVAQLRSAADVFEEVKKAVFVVVASTSMQGGTISQGSAVAISDRRLLTNCHVVGKANTVLLLNPERVVRAQVAARNEQADRCVLESEARLSHYVTVRSSETVQIGERVYSVGAPAGLHLGPELSLGEGIVSARRRIEGRELIQTTAPISPGSSGGGLFDAFGKLMGITTMRLRDSQNLNFAIPAEDYMR